MANVNDSYFDGHYKEIWRKLIPDILTTREVSFILNYFNLKPGDSVLDLMCGYGRHAIALAQKGIHVMAIDNLKDYTDEIQSIAEKHNLPIEVINTDLVEFEIKGHFNLAICMGNSLNFFNPEDTRKILSKVQNHLVPGGHLLINSWSIAEIALPTFKERTEGFIDNLKFINDSKILEDPKRIEIKSQMVDEEGNTETKTAVDYIYSLKELENILTECRLSLTEVFSIPGKKNFSAGEPRAYIIAIKK
jgi:cyclopropane fatty-acyl-phospholipid synthase-like methyltransferase